MELIEPEERIAAAICPPENPDFRDFCNTIRLQVQRECEEAQLQAYSYLLNRDGQEKARKLLLTDLIFEKRRKVDEYDRRIRLMREAKNPRPIR